MIIRPAPLAAAEIGKLRRIAREARNTYVGTHWPSMIAMRRDGIGFGLVEDAAHERFIRRYLDTFQPDFMVDLLDRLVDRDAARPQDPYQNATKHARQSTAGTHLYDDNCAFCWFEKHGPDATQATGPEPTSRIGPDGELEPLPWPKTAGEQDQRLREVPAFGGGHEVVAEWTRGQS